MNNPMAQYHQSSHTLERKKEILKGRWIDGSNRSIN